MVRNCCLANQQKSSGSWGLSDGDLPGRSFDSKALIAEKLVNGNEENGGPFETWDG